MNRLCCGQKKKKKKRKKRERVRDREIGAL